MDINRLAKAQRHWFAAVILQALYWMYPVHGKMCIPQYHSFVEFRETIATYKLKEFYHPGTKYYTQTVLDKKNSNVIVGARNELIWIDAEEFSLKKSKPWRISTATQSCLNKGHIKKDCQNYIQLIEPFDDKLFICGTNALKPVYNITKVNDPDTVITGNKDAESRCSPKHVLKSVSTVTRNGELMSAGFKDRNGWVALISASYLDISSKWQRLTTQRDRMTLNAPEFKANIAVYPSVFIFFNENALEKEGERTATVARICQNDNGGSLYILENQWTTFRKARLDCIVPGYEDMKFNIIEQMVYSKETEMFHGIFRTSNLSFKGSATCSFDLAQMRKIFDGDFLYMKSGDSQWKRVENPKHFTECEINTMSLRQYTVNEFNETVRPGKSPTNLMKYSALDASYRYKLMFDTVKALPNMVFYRQMQRFTAIAVDAFTGLKSQNNTLVYVGTDTGTVLVIHLIASKQPFCILEEIVLFKEGHEEAITNLNLWKEKQLLYISTDDRLLALNLNNCSRYFNESTCVQAHHPNCGWSSSEGKCISIRGLTIKANITQDLTKCPEKKGYWAAWSPWFTCLDSSSERNCRCRKRNCLTCNEKDCNGSSIDISSCSAVKVENETSWITIGPVDGQWSSWKGWSVCDHDSCGSGFQTRERLCGSPSPKNGGLPCLGNSRECRKCKVVSSASPCLHKTVVGAWSSCICFMEEGRDVSFGVQFRVRTCFSSCKNKKGCPSERVQNRTCACNSVVKATVNPGPIETPGKRSDVGKNDQGKAGFSLSDIVIAIVSSAILCIVIALIIIIWTIRRQRRKLLKERESFKEQDFALQALHRNGDGPPHSIDVADEKRPLSSSSENSLENGKQIPGEEIESPVATLAMPRTKRHPTGGKLKMFGEGRDYDKAREKP